MGIETDGYHARGNTTAGASKNNVERLGIYVGVVTDIKDWTRSGRVFAKLITNGEEIQPILYTTPFGGVTSHNDNVKDIKAYGSSIEETDGGASKSYGLWAEPPAVGTRILVCYAAGHSTPFYLGSIIEENLNHMMGGIASGYHYDSDQSIPFKPTSEKNKHDPSHIQRPVDTEAFNVLKTQGLEKDWARGHSSSSARREDPSRVFGITTRAGHVFSMDDGDTKGNNKNIRLRTRGGAQILIDDTNDFIFIINHAGTAWVEIDKDGKMDYYAKDDISFHTEGDFNVHAKGNFNVQSERQINMRSTGSGLGIRLDAAAGDIDLYASRNQYHQSGQNSHMKAGGRYYETASRIDMNGPAASAARRVQVHNHSQNKDVTKSASARVPEHHPWKGVTSTTESFTGSLGKSR